MDGTLNKFGFHFMNYVEARGFTFNRQGYYNNPTWHIETFIEAPKPKKVMNTILCLPEFWITIPPIEEAIPVLKSLSKVHDVQVVTTPWDSNIGSREVKVTWLKKYFSFLANKVTFTADKWLVDGDLMVDDKPSIIEKCNEVMKTICFAQPYNQGIACDYRTNSWIEIERIIEKMS